MSEKPLSIDDLTVAYRGKPVLWDIDLELPEGKLIAIIGPNGAGKSTLLKAILDLVPRTSGLVKVFGKKYRHQRKMVGYVPQRGSVDWDFPTTTLDIVMMGMYGKLGWIRRPGKKERETALNALEKVGMANFADRQIGQLSGGQQQRVFLARALVQDARLYLLDEPFSGVDASTEKAIVQLLKELKRDGKTVVCVHHDLTTASDYFDWAVLLNVHLIDAGPFDRTFTLENLQKTYGDTLQFLSHLKK